MVSLRTNRLIFFAMTSTQHPPSISRDSSSDQQGQTLTHRPAPPPTGLRTPSNRKTIYDRNLNRTRTAELSRASFAYLFSEMVTYAQKRVTGIQDLEKRFLHSPLFPLSPLTPPPFLPIHNTHTHILISKENKLTFLLFPSSPQPSPCTPFRTGGKGGRGSCDFFFFL